MAYRIIYHPKAEAELDKLNADIAVEAGTRIPVIDDVSGDSPMN